MPSAVDSFHFWIGCICVSRARWLAVIEKVEMQPTKQRCSLDLKGVRCERSGQRRVAINKLVQSLSKRRAVRPVPVPSSRTAAERAAIVLAFAFAVCGNATRHCNRLSWWWCRTHIPYQAGSVWGFSPGHQLHTPTTKRHILSLIPR